MTGMVRQRRHKYGARKTVYRDGLYDSAAEAAYAQHLDLLKAAGAIADWGRGAPIELIPGNRKQRVVYVPDFWVRERSDEAPFLVDVKGVETVVWRLKMRLLRHFRPDLRLKVVGTGGKERWL